MVNSGKQKGGHLFSRLPELKRQKELQLGRRISQNEIAEETGLNPMTVSRWMRPTPVKALNDETIVAFCQYFECEIGDLLEIEYA
jgi:DNA-binding Xre family transcriptional regulator